MKICGNDLILLGLSIAIAGTLILAKGYVFKSPAVIRDESASYFGANPFKVKNKIIQKWEAIGGLILILPAGILQLIGVFLNLTNQKTESIFTKPLSNLIFLLLLSVVLVWGMVITIGFVAKGKYMPELKTMLKEAMEQTDTVLRNDGLYVNEVEKDIDVKRDTRNARLQSMDEKLNRWKRLFGFPKKKNETSIDYFVRLKNYLDPY